MATLQCKTEIPSIEGLNENELTVGREFLLVCDGDFPKDIAQDKLHFNLKPEEKYKIHLLGFEFRSPTQADVKVTAYQAGSIQFQELQLTDGSHTLSLGAIHYDVQSVLPKPEPGQGQVKQEPYGPVGPASLSVPLLYWGILAGFFVFLFLVLITKVLRIVQRRNMLERLKEHDSALSPLAQFHQSMRRLQRVNTVFFGGAATKEDIAQCLTETGQMLKLYLTRRYQMPALEWSDRLILKDLKKYNPKIFAEFGDELQKLLKEYQRGQQDQASLIEQDVLNIATQCRQLVEKMERVSL